MSSHSHSQSSDVSIILQSLKAWGAASNASSCESFTSRLMTSSASPPPPPPHVLNHVIKHSLLEANHHVDFVHVLLPPLRTLLDRHVPLEHFLQPVPAVQRGILRHEIVINLTVSDSTKVVDVRAILGRPR
eukprot:CAMPEP_0198701564 /NCGR_PEP_ID=MMETSP1468-20131203/387023_1 /TAXON_ID=1461545 /ORGANISM="Mantoniella sp, Strain CCMP1436" /LENGTH=130 /DNA_ID=CAMNT_0044459947 /DNA_START=272 /DNA_END=664 /DNA_ORIENTATION=+